MDKKKLYELFDLLNWFTLAGALILLTTSVVGELNDLSFYTTNFPYFWAGVGILLNLSFIPPLYRMGISRRAFNYQVWFGVISVLSLFIAAVSALEILKPSSNGPYLLVIAVFSASAAALGWVIHVQLSSRTHRKNHTLNLLMQSRISSEYQQQLRAFTSIFDPKKIEVQDLEKYQQMKKAPLSQLDDKSRELYDSLNAARYLMNYFEFLAIGIDKDDLDEDLLFECLSYIICNMHELCGIFISDAQERDPELYKNLCSLVYRWSMRTHENSQQPIKINAS